MEADVGIFGQRFGIRPDATSSVAGMRASRTSDTNRFYCVGHPAQFSSEVRPVFAQQQVQSSPITPTM